MFEAVSERVGRAIQEHVFPGCVVGVIRKDGERFLWPFGTFTYEVGSRPMTSESLFDVASITKVLPTGSLALGLIDEGRLSLEDRLIDYVPEFQNSSRDSVLIKHLLTYTISYDSERLSSFRDRTSEELLRYIFTREFAAPPGTVFQQSNTAPFLLGLVIERITGKYLHELAESYFFAPLGMRRTTFFPSQFSHEEIVPTEIVEGRGLVCGEVHDESAYVLRAGKHRSLGQAGLFSTASDLLTFIGMLLLGGQKDGRVYFRGETVRHMHTNQIPELSESMGLGWELREPVFMGSMCGPHTFGKTGFTGTLLLSDPDREIGLTLLSNRIYPRRPADSTAINEVRRNIADSIWNSTR